VNIAAILIITQHLRATLKLSCCAQADRQVGNKMMII